MNYNIDEIKELLHSMVDEKRYNHSLMVADEAVKLAKAYNLDIDKTYVTGLVHDIAKNFSIEENKRLAKKYNLENRIFDYDYRNVLHADIGACYVLEKYNFSTDMYNAIKYHAIGNPNMDMLSKVIYIADKTGRSKLDDDMLEVKKYSYIDIDKAIIMFIDIQRDSLIERGLKEQRETKELYELLCKGNI